VNEQLADRNSAACSTEGWLGLPAAAIRLTARTAFEQLVFEEDGVRQKAFIGWHLRQSI
jgi:hypothetical protein